MWKFLVLLATSLKSVLWPPQSEMKLYWVKVMAFRTPNFSRIKSTRCVASRLLSKTQNQAKGNESKLSYHCYEFRFLSRIFSILFCSQDFELRILTYLDSSQISGEVPVSYPSFIRQVREVAVKFMGWSLITTCFPQKPMPKMRSSHSVMTDQEKERKLN